MLMVTGASGHLGQSVLKHLLQTLAIAPSNIAAGSRNPFKLHEYAKKGISTRHLDFDNAYTFKTAFYGVERVVLISANVASEAGLRTHQHRRAISAMESAGVKHVVYISMAGADKSLLPMAANHIETEKILVNSQIQGWTILRSHWHFENLALCWPPVASTGRWYSANNGMPSTDIARDDVGRAAATVLASDETWKRIYTLSGPQALTRDRLLQCLNATLGTLAMIAPVSPDALIDSSIAAGMITSPAQMHASLDVNVAQGNLATVTDDFHKITGVAPQPFDSWLTENEAFFKSIS